MDRGGGVIICPGVEVGRGAIIAAGSVVTKDCKENCLYAGNPARIIKRLDEGGNSKEKNNV